MPGRQSRGTRRHISRWGSRAWKKAASPPATASKERRTKGTADWQTRSASTPPAAAARNCSQSRIPRLQSTRSRWAPMPGRWMKVWRSIGNRGSGPTALSISRLRRGDQQQSEVLRLGSGRVAFGVLQRGAGDGGDEIRQPLFVRAEQALHVVMGDVQAGGARPRTRIGAQSVERSSQAASGLAVSASGRRRRRRPCRPTGAVRSRAAGSRGRPAPATGRNCSWPSSCTNSRTKACSPRSSRSAAVRTSAKIMAGDRAEVILRPTSSTVSKRSTSESVAGASQRRWQSLAEMAISRSAASALGHLLLRSRLAQLPPQLAVDQQRLGILVLGALPLGDRQALLEQRGRRARSCRGSARTWAYSRRAWGRSFCRRRPTRTARRAAASRAEQQLRAPDGRQAGLALGLAAQGRGQPGQAGGGIGVEEP